MSIDIEINKIKPQMQSGPENTNPNSNRINKGHMAKQKFLNKIMLLILLIALGLSGYFYYKLHRLESTTNGKQEAQDLLAKVAKHYLIPTGEEPTVATVSDPIKLKDQAFFTNAQKDDKVLIFTQAGKAVLYRPSIDKIIEVAPINNKKDETPPPEKSTGPLKDKTF